MTRRVQHLEGQARETQDVAVDEGPEVGDGVERRGASATPTGVTGRGLEMVRPLG